MLVRVKGNLKFEELVWHPQVFMEDPNFQPGLNILYDLRSLLEVGGDLEFLHDSIDRLKDPDFIPVVARTAFCITPDSSSLEHIFDGICIMTRGSRVEHSLFKDLFDAFDYLYIPKEKQELMAQHLAKL